MHRALTLSLPLLVAIGTGCPPDKTDDTGVLPEVQDLDGDGWAGEDDCDDDNAEIHPDAEETCNGADDNCNGEIDEDAVDASTWYADTDADGFGDAEVTELACEQAEGWVDDDSDCDDTDAASFPGADEICDEADNDCDGDIDEDAIDADTLYADEDEDGYGDGSQPVTSCEFPAGYVGDDSDCDDTDATVHPDADELCNGIDDDCDGEIDEDDATDAPAWYQDADSDGYGDPSVETVACAQPTGFVDNDFDCDDSDDAVNPDADELCNGYDDDCDGTTDELGAVDAPTWYEDVDGDGFGDATSTTDACEAPSGWVELDSDCDDNDAAQYPGADEYCNGEDDDCDGTVDEDDAIDASTFYADADSDGYGDPDNTTVACYQPSNTVTDSTDCDDSDAAVNPAATELCDGIDNDCDGTVDEDDADDASTWYADSDGDGYGSTSTTAVACYEPSGFVADDTDCDDSDALINPGVPELCDFVDNDCDGTVDEDDADDASTWYADSDSDGYGVAATTTTACAQPTGYVADDSDCDDTDDARYPGADEYCNGVDDDCDGTIDEDHAVDVSTWYADDDGDGHGDAADTAATCEQPSGFVADNTDCDDGDDAQYPGADEYCNSEDDDCDGTTDEDDALDASTWYADTDSDGHGDGTADTQACSQPTGYVVDAVDCDDSDATQYPGADEHCNGEDDDCDGTTDEDDAVDADTWYADDDSDGYGDAGSTTAACSQPSGYVADATDCDDGDSSISPAATEVCDAVDNDCDGTTDEGVTTTYYLDDDSDGYGLTASTTDDCDVPSGYSPDDGDCDDGDDEVYPGADEYCNGVDDDCDGTVDEDDAVDAATWYIDADLDGYGDDSTTTEACSEPSGYVSDDTDCDDDDDGVNPGASEVCDGADNDCDGTADDGVLGTGGSCTAEDCSEILDDDPSAADGTYELDDGSYYCDMTSDGGGWTLVGEDVAVWGTSYDTTYYNSEGFSWTEALFSYASGSAHGHCTYPSSLTGCNNIGMQFASESWGVALNWGASLCGMSTTDYTSATTYIGGYDWTIARSESTDTIRVGLLEAVASCTTSDNPGTAYMDILIRR